MTRKEKLDLAGWATIIACLFTTIALFGWWAYLDSQMRFELRTSEWVLDYELTREDCKEELDLLRSWTQGQTDAQCVRTR